MLQWSTITNTLLISLENMRAKMFLLGSLRCTLSSLKKYLIKHFTMMIDCYEFICENLETYISLKCNTMQVC
jgi:hypothetical protein